MKKVALFILFCILILSSCGPIGAALGILEATKEKSRDANAAPTIIDLAVTNGGSADNTPMEFTYKIVDAESNVASITVEYSDDGGTTWKVTAEGSGSDGVGSLSSSPTGTAHIYKWDYKQNFTGASINLKVRLTPGGGIPIALNNVRGGNTSPGIQFTPLSGLQSGNVVIGYTLTDGENDGCLIQAEYSLDGGVNWFPATTSGGDGIPVGGKRSERTGVQGAIAGANRNFVWDSKADGAGKSLVSALVRFSTFDLRFDGSVLSTGEQKISSAFSLDNGKDLNTAPTVEIVGIGEAGKTGKLKIIYRLKDSESDSCSLRDVEWSDDSGASWNRALRPQITGNPILDGDGITGLSSSPTGVLHSFVWDTGAEKFLQGRQWINIRITPEDNYGRGSPVKSRLFYLRGWKPSLNLSNRTEPSREPAGALDSRGNLHIVWRDVSGGILTIFYSRYDGVSWTAPTAVKAATDQYSPAIAIDSNDTIHLVWRQSIFSLNYGIYYVQSADGGANWDGDPSTPALDPAREIGALSGNAEHPTIRIDSQNNLHIVWHENFSGFPATSIDVRYAKSIDGGRNWSGPDNISQTGSLDSSYPTLGIDRENRLHICYQEGNQIYYTYHNGSSWSSKTQITSAPGGESAQRPSLAVDGTGTLHLVWQQGPAIGGGNNEIFYSRYDGTSWSPEVNLSNNLSLSSEPVIGLGPDNSIHVLWTDQITGTYDVFYTRQTMESWSSPANLTENTTDSLMPALLVDSRGTLHVLWSDNNLGGSDDIFYVSYEGSLAWTAPYNISNQPNFSTRPALDRDSQNRLYLIWQDKVTGNTDVFYSSFDGLGWSPKINLSQNTGSNFSQEPAIAVNKTSGRIYLVWRQSAGNNEIFYTQSGDGGNTWDSDPSTPALDPPKNISNTSGISLEPAIAVDSGGYLHAIWRDNTGFPSYRIFYTQSRDGGATWDSDPSTPALDPPKNISGTLNVSNLTNRRACWLSTDSQGRVHVVFHVGAIFPEIYYTRSADGGATWDGDPSTPALDPPKNISNSAGISQDPTIAVDSNDRIHLAWQEGGEIFYTQSGDGGATWDSDPATPALDPPLNASNTSATSQLPFLGADSQGNPHLVWQDYTPGNEEILYSVRKNNTWRGAVKISDTSLSSERPVLVVDSSNITHVLWEEGATNNEDIAYSRDLFPREFFTADFELITPPSLPTGWTALGGWATENGNKIGTGNNYAVISGAATNADLTTPVIDCSKYATVYLQFDQNFSVTTTGGASQTLTVDISNDGGTAWNPVPPSSTGSAVVQMTQNTGNNAGTIRVDISRYASGQSQVMVRWRYNNTGTDGFWAIDNVKVEQGNSYTGN